AKGPDWVTAVVSGSSRPEHAFLGTLPRYYTNNSIGGRPVGWAWSNTTQAWWCWAMLVASALSNHWIRWVRAITAANGRADISAAARRPAIHWSRTNNANCPCTLPVKRSA